MKYLVFAVVFPILFFALVAARASTELPDAHYQLSHVYIAHAGGRVDGMAYTNSLEALETGYLRGYRVFELDFSWTADDQLVLIHDWDQTWARFSSDGQDVPTLARFLQSEHLKGLLFLSLDDLLEWLRIRQDAKIVTDVKQRNVEALQLIARKAPELRDRFIPQIYGPEEYAPVRESGFKNVLFTVYRSNLSGREIGEFVTKNAVAGLVIPEYRARRGDFDELLLRGSLNIFVHTINDEATWEELRARGYHGIYTDDLID